MNDLSVLMSLYHAESPLYLDECLASLSSQTIKAEEVVLVIDGPISNALQAVVDKWIDPLNIHILPLKENVGLGSALNVGIKKCRNKLVARMDTDDICLPNRFEEQLKLFSANKNLAICGTSAEEVDPKSLLHISFRITPLSNIDIIKRLPYENPFNHPTVMFKKDAAISAGGYQDLPWMEDWYLWIRILSAGYEGGNIPQNLVKMRSGKDMISRRSGLEYVKSEWKITKIKKHYHLAASPKLLLIFLSRSLPRLLPHAVLRKIYLMYRKL